MKALDNIEVAAAYVDGKAFEITPGETILNFTKRTIGEKQVPTLCDDPRLKPYGACRVCSVEVALKADGPVKTIASCHTPVTAGMHVFTQTDSLQKLRKNIIELVISDHPLDCLTCEVNGNCQLQDVAADVGLRDVRYGNGDNHLSREKDSSHAYMRMDLAKCINCARCVRACDEIQGSFVLGMEGRGFESKIIKDNDLLFGDSSCVSCGACAETCPTAAITDRFQSKALQADNTVRTTCSYCGVGCNLEVSVRNNEVQSIRAPWDAEVNQGHTCLKGRYAFRFYNHPDRLRTPLIRQGSKFVEATWDEAYDFIANKLEKISKNNGPDSIAGISSSRCTNEENYLMQKFIRAVIGTNNIDCCARVCHSPTAWGMQQSFGTGAATNSIEDIKYTDCMVVIGANPTAAHPVTGAKIKQQAMAGSTLIVIDPVKTELAELADYHLQLRPGTNVAMLNLMLHFIVTEGLADEQFVKTRCEDYDLFKKQILNIDVEAMAEVAGVSADLAKEAALAYANANNAMSFHGLGVTEHSQGAKTVMLIANLAMITGNIGRAGVGVNPLRGQNNVQGAADMGCQPHQGAGYLEVMEKETQDYYANAYGVASPTTEGKKIPEMFDAAIAGDLKAIWIMGEDVAQTDPNTAHVIKALTNLDLLVVQEIFFTETAKLADVILPGASFLEKNGTFTNGERRIQRVQAVVPPLSGSKADGDIMVEIMNRMGYQQPAYAPGTMLEEISRVVPFFAGVTWQNLGDHGLQWPVLKGGVDTKILHSKDFKRGKGKFHYFDFEETTELLDNAASFPFILTTGRNLEHYNAGTMTRRTHNAAIVDKDILLINPKDAKAKGIHTGDAARLFSDRGEVEIIVEVSKKIKPGVLFTTFHFPEFMVNNVTSNVVDSETMCPEYKVVAVDVERLAARKSA
ncbi:MAG: formate dehydrogenase subunit alpha [Proteobacteria bacterium]|jgi:formate dehydrogenase major subunit|nr:formate dehydrogenase subunit alpha [Pseudomonadota bacterium]